MKLRIDSADMTFRGAASLALAMVGLAFGHLGCSPHESGVSVSSTVGALTNANTLSSAALQLTVSKNSCASDGAQNYFNVSNAGTVAAQLSNLTIKYWVYDTSGSPVIPHVWYGGCVTTSNGTCTHQVTGVSAIATPFPVCGPDAAHQANWEITVSTTDSALIPPGSTWSGTQTAINLANYAAFSPGSASWFSGCGSGQPFRADPNFAVYSQGSLVATNGITAPACRAPHGAQPLTGYLNKLGIVNAPIIGLVPPATNMGMTIALPLKPVNADGLSLDAFIKQASDPTSPQYRHYLTPDTFATSFGPDPADYQKLLSWASSVGLTVVKTYSNNSLLYVRGTAGAIDNALFANLVQRTRPDGTVFHSLDREPSLTLPVPVLRISGLDNLVVPRAFTIPCPATTSGSPNQNGSGDNGLFRGNDYRNLYASCTSLDGGGGFPQAIGLFEMDNFVQLDVSEYLRLSNIVDKTINQVSVNVGGDNHQYDNGPEEVLVDIDVAAAMAPGAEITVFGGLGPESVDFQNGIFGLMATAVPLPSVLSSSWTFEVDEETAQLVGQFAAQGQSLFQSSGDDGSYMNTGDPEDNRDLPYTTLVGATVVSTSGVGGPYLSEAGWAGSSGGQFLGTEGVFGIGEVDNVPIPDYQKGVVSASGSGVDPDLRNAPDVSMLGANAEIYRGCKPQVVAGIETGEIDCPGFGECGTSVATPLWAAFTALVNQKTEASGIGSLGFVNPVLYGIEKNATVYSTSFNDVTAGSNPAPAGPGYDLVTGIGSPKCALIDQLASKTPTLPLDANPPPPSCSTAQITIAGESSQFADVGPVICGKGTGFTPNGAVTIEYDGLPGGQAAFQVSIGPATPTGDLKFLDNSQENEIDDVNCSSVQVGMFVNTVITDQISGCTVKSAAPAVLWCKNRALTEFGNGCPMP